MAPALRSLFRLRPVLLALPVLAGCPNVGTAPPLPEHRSYTPVPVQLVDAVATPGLFPVTSSSTGTDSPSSTGRPSPLPSLRPLPTVSPASPLASPSRLPFNGPTAPLQGKVFDEQGALLDGALVKLRSLSATAPYEDEVPVQGGSYVFKAAPAGVQLELTASRPGWTTRTRVVVAQAGNASRNDFDFGSLAGGRSASDPAGAALFLSDAPELVSAEPDTATLQGERLSYRLRFSEDLPQPSQELVERAFQLDSLPPLAALMPESLTAVQKAERHVIQRGSGFLGNRQRLTFTWTDAQSVTVAFGAPLRRRNDEQLAYRFQLLRRSGDELVRDGSGKPLGLGDTEVGQAYFAQRKASLQLVEADNTPILRWQATHQRSGGFSVAKDSAAPVLKGVAVTDTSLPEKGGAAFYQFDLTFSEPMRVYPDDRGYAASMLKLENYVFAMSTRSLDGIDLSKDVAAFTTSDSAANFVGQFADPRRPFSLVNPADSLPGNDCFVRPGEGDARVVSVFVPKLALPTNLAHVKVRVKPAVTDPAGNAVSEANVDSARATADNVVVGRF